MGIYPKEKRGTGLDGIQCMRSGISRIGVYEAVRIETKRPGHALAISPIT